MADCGPLAGPACIAANVIGGEFRTRRKGAVNSAVDSGANSLGEAMMGGAWDSIMKGFLTSCWTPE